ncbi:ATP-binding protein [Ruminiclostridium herbifermentans]|uniref:ATP-binding protein n=1 Tax=Ruminiclostridium herbifermentans TaxID=2488810 RepID=A0A7H1VJI6_9FIRM|nr:IS21-like element helper ATPase IstB [Ruminiclostridium herbifermentans]QNU65548.1 ATP-binding protein [Ruminiclostridium herbifermentans]QNU65613.1 ATP-binding protein [Ruminiclostridium herbifermentans]QNU65819.1 ATP-binding protein [Ruminiclostridium herbifermentans]QNU65888.1 ATP-binding protein [Ruminiclostridium herbifermentans]QNU66334.1 ATP-binding protein [Ruminiclostridium herbifermentans]
MNNSTYNQLCRNMEILGLGQMVIHLDEISNFVTSNNLSFTEGLLRLSNYEVDFKEAKASRSMIKAAAFPFVKELKDYDFNFQPSVNQQEIQELCTLGFLERNENIVFLGPSGVGKTHLATSIGIAAAKKRTSTYFIKCHDLLQQLKKAKLENRLDVRLRHFCHYRLLIIDELGYLPIDKEDSNMFFQLIDMRYERKSTILTTNMNFNEWDGVFYDAVVANAILDRVLHHAHVISISGKSYRLKDHMKQGE